MQPTQLTPEQPTYPQTLRLSNAPPTLTAIGNLDILQRQLLGVIASAQCPETVQAEWLNYLQTQLPPDTAVISGFHSPLERECFSVLLAKGHPTIRCVAHGLAKPAVSNLELQALTNGQHLLLSPFSASVRRADRALTARRNRVVATIAHQVLIPYAAPGSKTEAIAQMVVALNKPLLTLACLENHNLTALGATFI